MYHLTGNSDGGSINGVQYDHVFPVEMEVQGGVQSLNIGYNNLESPFDAAQRFINENGVPQHHLRQIAEWISARAGKCHQHQRHSTPCHLTHLSSHYLYPTLTINQHTPSSTRQTSADHR